MIEGHLVEDFDQEPAMKLWTKVCRRLDILFMLIFLSLNLLGTYYTVGLTVP